VKFSTYIETSVISYLTARLSKDLVIAAHQQITHEWWDRSLQKFNPYISPVVIEEISRGDEGAAVLRLERVKDIPILKINPDIERLSEKYFSHLRIPNKAKADTYHLAIACWHKIDFLVTWNCTHLANGFIIKQLEKINLELGVKSPIICTPEELMEVYNER
jgi:predicted nucleic acid-binding protein